MEKKHIRAKPFIEDVRAGKTRAQLMKDYSLSESELVQVMTKLVTAGLLEKAEVDLSANDPIKLLESQRAERRCYLATALPVHDIDDLLSEGQLLDISSTGFRVSGIAVQAGEEKNMVTEVSQAADLYPLCVTAL